MSKRFPVIVLPLEIIKQSDFANKIEGTNLNIAEVVEYLKKFIEDNH
jgi:hypothetical protein